MQLRNAFASTQPHGDHPGYGLPIAENRSYLDANLHPIGTDPLTVTELALAQDISASSADIRQAQVGHHPNTPLLSPVQFVSAERHDAEKSALPTPRRADVVFYNYATDQVIRQVVNLETREVEATHMLPGQDHQPPVANIEAEAALRMILAHPTLSQQLQQAFLQATGGFLLRAEQVQAQGLLFVPSDAPQARLADVARACQRHRCIQLILQTERGMIDASNLVVDLSSGQLLWADVPFKALVFEDETAAQNSPPKNTKRDADFVCASGQPIVVTMTIGTRWGLCWVHDPSRGLVFNQVSFAPANGAMTLILGSAALAQIEAADDDGLTRQHVLGERELPLSVLTTTDCPQGTLLRDAVGAAVACQSMQPRGYAWRGADQIQGQSFTLFGVSYASGDTWTHQWVFDDDGAMHPMLGVSLGISPGVNGRREANRSITVYWRLNFDIGGSADDEVEQFDYMADPSSPMTRTQTSLLFTRETSSTLSPEAQRFWRIKDTKLTNSAGQNISYQIVPQLTSVYRSSDALMQSDVFVTNNKACEQFASHNPTTGGCGAGMTDFVNSEALDDPTSDSVMWYGTTWHQVWAKEDELLARTHWQGLTLLPRDFLSASPLLAAQPSVSSLPAPLAAPGSITLNCSSPYQITQSFTSTAKWEMCWEPRTGYGYRLNQITFTPAHGTPRLILNALHVALMFVPYDDGGPRYRDTSLGKNLATLTSAECADGLLLPGDTLCLVRRDNNRFVVFGYFNVANYYYVIQFTFNDDGSIAPAVGASGSLQRYTHDATTGWPVHGLVATNHNHWVIWRMDFDLDGAADDQVKQFDVVSAMGSTRTLSATLLLTETKTRNDLNYARFWRVYGDASPTALTYEIEPNVTDIYRADEAFTQNDFYVTQNHTDEAFVSDAFALDSFVNGEALQDEVVWYGVNFHHVPRSEDDLRMPIHWQGFVMRLQDRGLALRLFMPLLLR